MCLFHLYGIKRHKQETCPKNACYCPQMIDLVDIATVLGIDKVNKCKSGVYSYHFNFRDVLKTSH